MKKRGQAAMEFLMTYGWAILAAVIVVGVLWYLIGDPSNLAGNNFQLSAPLAANAMSLDGSANTVTIEFRNGEASSINITEINLPEFSCTDTPNTAHPAGNLTAYTINCADDFNSGDRFNSELTIKYLKQGSNVEQIATGSVSGTVP